MIATQKINSTTDKIKPLTNYESINVLKWKNSKWKELSPYLLRTDGLEKCVNDGNVLFENYWQGVKVFDIVYENKVYASKFHVNKPEHLWWDFKPENDDGDIIYDIETKTIMYDSYYRWRNSLYSCDNPIRYPNKIHRRANTQFALYVDKNGNEKRLDYIKSRKQIYLKEYVRLIKKTNEYELLLNKLCNNENLLICEVDVPSYGKKGAYGLDIDDNGNCHMSLEKLEILLNDGSEAFGHGLCICYALLKDLEKINK